MIDHVKEAERHLEFRIPSDVTALTHAVLALVERLDELPVMVLTDEDEDEDDD